MPAPAASNNDLVTSDEDIMSAVSAADAADGDHDALDPEPAGLTHDADPDDDGTRAWETRDDQDTDADETDTPSRTRATAVREFKANGKSHQVDMADQAKVDQLISLGLGARRVFSERDQLKTASQAKDAQIAELARYKDNWTKLEQAKHNKAELYEKIFGTKWADDVKSERDWHDRYTAASPAERQLMDDRRKMEADRRQADADRVAREAETTQLQTERDNLKRDRIQATMTPEFQRYEFSARIKDEATAARLNKALWRLSISELRAEYGDKDDIPPSAIRKAFRETHDMLWGQHRQGAEQTVRKVVDDKKKQAKEQAQAASTRNYGASKKSKPMPSDPVKLWNRMFG